MGSYGPVFTHTRQRGTNIFYGNWGLLANLILLLSLTKWWLMMKYRDCSRG